jgi:hypothetical protein
MREHEIIFRLINSCPCERRHQSTDFEPPHAVLLPAHRMATLPRMLQKLIRFLCRPLDGFCCSRLLRQAWHLRAVIPAFQRTDPTADYQTKFRKVFGNGEVKSSRWQVNGCAKRSLPEWRASRGHASDLAP